MGILGVFIYKVTYQSSGVYKHGVAETSYRDLETNSVTIKDI